MLTLCFRCRKQIESAKQAATKIEAELGDLSSTLKNIEDARPFDQLTVSSWSCSGMDSG